MGCNSRTFIKINDSGDYAPWIYVRMGDYAPIPKKQNMCNHWNEPQVEEEYVANEPYNELRGGDVAINAVSKGVWQNNDVPDDLDRSCADTGRCCPLWNARFA